MDYPDYDEQEEEECPGARAFVEFFKTIIIFVVVILAIIFLISFLIPSEPPHLSPWEDPIIESSRDDWPN